MQTLEEKPKKKQNYRLSSSDPAAHSQLTGTRGNFGIFGEVDMNFKGEKDTSSARGWLK